MKKLILLIGFLGIGLSTIAMQSVKVKKEKANEWPALHGALIEQLDYSGLEKLLANKTINVNEVFYKLAPIHLAVTTALDKPKLALEQIKALAQAGADLEIKNADGETPLEMAQSDVEAGYGSQAIVDYLTAQLAKKAN